MSNVGFRIHTKINRPSKELINSFAGLPVSNIADNMNRMFCADFGIKPYNNAKLFGCAFTVKVAPGDNLMFHKALDLAQPGDVLIVDGQGDTTNSICGEILSRYAKSRGLAGFVVDGAIRDAGGIRELDFPVYARGVNPKGPYKNGPGEINIPVACGGVVVHPGYIVVGDEDGVVFINPDDAEVILKNTQALAAIEAKTIAAIEAGTMERSWIDKVLKEKGCEIVD